MKVYKVLVGRPAFTKKHFVPKYGAVTPLFIVASSWVCGICDTWQPLSELVMVTRLVPPLFCCAQLVDVVRAAH